MLAVIGCEPLVGWLVGFVSFVNCCNWLLNFFLLVSFVLCGSQLLFAVHKRCVQRACVCALNVCMCA